MNLLRSFDPCLRRLWWHCNPIHQTSKTLGSTPAFWWERQRLSLAQGVTGEAQTVPAEAYYGVSSSGHALISCSRFNKVCWLGRLVTVVPYTRHLGKMCYFFNVKVFLVSETCRKKNKLKNIIIEILLGGPRRPSWLCVMVSKGANTFTVVWQIYHTFKTIVWFEISPMQISQRVQVGQVDSLP